MGGRIANVCVIRQGRYPFDPRVRREVDALVSQGHEVDVICLKRPEEARRERRGPVRVYRMPLRHRRASAARYVLEHASFFCFAAVLSGLLHLRRRYALVQVHSIPDSIVFAAIVPRLLGARVLFDLHECMPEFLMTRYSVRAGSPLARAIARVEQAGIRFADGAITCTEQMREAFVGRGAPREKIGVVLNAAEESVFDPVRHPPRPRDAARFVLICHGSLEERYGVDTAIRAAALLDHDIPGLRLEIYGEGSYRDALRELASELGVTDRVAFSDGFVPLEDLIAAISQADAGVVAMKRDAFRDLTHCNKMFDLIAMRRPAIVSRTASVEAYFGEGCFQYFTSDDEEDLARAIRELHRDPSLAARLVERAAEVNEPYRWPRQREVYLEIVGRVLAGDPPSPSPGGEG